MTTILQDLRFGFRMLWKNFGLTAVAILSLALGIGANTTIFGIVDAIYLRPLPVRNPEQLAAISTQGPRKELDLSSYVDFLDLKNQVASFSDVLAHGTRGTILNLEGKGELDTVDVVSPNYFSAFGVQPALGRFFLPGPLTARVKRTPLSSVTGFGSGAFTALRASWAA